jgi:phosphoserine phosphatase
VRGIYAQIVYLLLGADDEKMERMREAMLGLTKGWDQSRVSEIVRETLDDVLTPIIYAEALELIETHKAQGARP